MALALKISGTSYTLPQASVRSLVHTVQACQPAKLVAQIYAPAIPTTTIPAFAAIELWVDSVRRFSGTLTTAPRLGYDDQGSYIELNAADVLGRLRSITYERPVLTWTGITSPAPAEWGFPEGMVVPLYRRSANWTSTVGLFSSGTTYMGTDEVGDLSAIRSSSSSAAELARLVAFLSTRAGITMELGTLSGLPEKNTGDVVTDLDCLSAIQRCANLRPDAVFWIDPSAGTARLNYITRDHCTEVTLDCASRDRITANECVARDDLQVGYIQWTLKWEVVRSDGSWYPYSNVYEYGDSTCPPERRIIRTFHLGKFAHSTAVTGLPYVWEIPTGAAAAYWAAASVLHYEGSASVYEPDGVSYDYGLGQVINFSNWQPAYATARALVRGVSYDLVARRTSISFGPPDSITPQDYLSISASSLGSSSPTTDPTDPTTDPSDPSAPGSGDLPAHVTGGLAGQYSILSTTGEVQAIEGTAELKGWEINPGFTAATPPDKYLSATASGSVSGTGGCGWGDTMSWSGTSTVDPTTGAVTAGQIRVSSAEGTSARERLESSESGSVGYAEWGMCNTSATTRSVKLTRYYGPYCNAPTSFNTGGCGWFYGSGEIVETLGNKDSDAAALARLGDTWGTPTELSLRTFWGQRTTGFSFSVRRCRLHEYSWTCSIYGLPVKVTIPLYKYAIGGTKPATPTATQPFILDLVQVGVTTTSPQGLTLTEYHGKATLPDWEIPIEQGYVIEAGTPTITLL